VTHPCALAPLRSLRETNKLLIPACTKTSSRLPGKVTLPGKKITFPFKKRIFVNLPGIVFAGASS
jgi:hypothetical protein